MQKVARLKDTFVPSHYDLFLAIDRPSRVFKGTVKILGNSKSSSIALHSKALDIQSVQLNGLASQFKFGDQDQLIIDGAESGDVEILIHFTGKITDPMHGMYPCYFKHDGKDKELIATQFESHHAREVFPCVDEPAGKATFSLTLETETGVNVISNMPVSKQVEKVGRLTTVFEQTPKMSPYLLAWVYGELHSKSAKTKRGVEVNVWATLAQSSDSFDFALDTAKRAIEFYEDYFGVDYPLPKSDHIALPDFDSLAMENWGLITYREVGLLAKPGASSIDLKKQIALVVCHELAHQWFGNLVTMNWWDDLWLNESFAKMMEHLSVDNLFPDWNIWLEFTVKETAYSLRRDSIDGVQPVKIEVNHPDEIMAIFDPAIVYAKGAKLIKMMRGFVGDEAFREGLRAYFKDHAYGNTTDQDLWRAMAKASSKDVGEFMSTWLNQPGFPVVEISRKGDLMSLSQQRFFVGPHKAADQIWPIPLDATCSKPPQVLSKKSVSFKREFKNKVILNKNDNSHFITHYSDDILEQILDEVKNGKLSPVQKAQLLNDYVLLARSGRVRSTKLLDILPTFANEDTHQVWDMVFGVLAELRKFVTDDEPAEKKLRELSFSLARAKYEELGWEPRTGETENDAQMRTTAISMSIYGEHPEAIQKAKEIYTRHKLNLETINPEIRALVMSAATRYGEDSIVDELLEAYKSTTNADLRDDICVGATSTKSLNKIKLLLTTILDTKTVRPQDSSHWYIYLVRGRESRELAWQWLRDNWSWVEDIFGNDKTYDAFPKYTATALYSTKHIREYEDFFGPMKSEPSLKRVIEMGVSENKRSP